MNIRYLLDTNAASYAINRKNSAFDRRLTRCTMAELAISAVTEGELHYGAARRFSAPLESVIERFLLAITIIAWDSAAARRFGELRARLEREGQVMGGFDMMIAAQALALGVTLVTNDRAFARIRRIEDWTE
ncbi:MAG: type II toxin-antitoxin system VapC family toxin [Acidobacteria bacterium]|nr:type II toxin-antitoxin system VapC family toxin [Acidobacteriota bacterium]